MTFGSKYKKQLISAAITAVFTALAVILSRFLSINIWNMSIGFSFVPLMLCGMLTGVIFGGVCAALTDFLGATLFPFGPYFPGFTATAFLSGVLFGVIGVLANKTKGRWVFAALCTVILAFKELVCSLLLNSLWISILYGSEYTAVLISRIPLSLATLVLEIIFAVICKASLIPAINKNKERF